MTVAVALGSVEDVARRKRREDGVRDRSVRSSASHYEHMDHE